ncbi:methyltransferase [candidate division KSB1 bacterium]|nr:methyltransferase [candidate division KSB1 bacterium]RQW05098.1 MAG: methyltransferase [candidate division KSB1 bacterium]
MTSRERVLITLKHQQPDKIPVDFGSTAVTGIHCKMVADLRDYFDLEKRLVKVHEPYQMLGLVEPDLQEALGVDVEGIPGRETLFGFPNENWQEWTFLNGFTVLVSSFFQVDAEEDGSCLIYPKGDRSARPSGRMPKGGYFFDTIVRQEPIDDTKLNVEDNLEEFNEMSEVDLVYFAEQAQQARETGRAVIAGFGGTALGDIALVPAPFLTNPKGIRDISEWYMSTLIRQDYVKEIFDRQTHIAVKNLEKLWQRVGHLVDIVFICGTDFGTQNSTFCSVETYRDVWMPYYKRLNDWIHQNTSWKTFKHSCGAVETLIDSFIESGFDILNPVQVAATGMDPMHLKSTYGQDITFWGGGIDTQTTLMFNSPEEVRAQVLKHCEIFGKDGGFVYNTVHNIQGNVPVDNVVAMIRALHEFNGEAYQ